MAKGAKRGRIVQPSGDVVTITSDEREFFVKTRAKHGWSTRFVADRIGCSNGTITNIEKGTSSQIKRVFYVELVRLYKGEKIALGEDTGSDGVFKDITEKLVKLDSRGLAIVQASIDAYLTNVVEKK